MLRYLLPAFLILVATQSHADYPVNPGNGECYSVGNRIVDLYIGNSSQGRVMVAKVQDVLNGCGVQGGTDRPPSSTAYNSDNAFYVYMALSHSSAKETMGQLMTALTTGQFVNIYYQVTPTTANVYYYCKTNAHFEGLSLSN